MPETITTAEGEWVRAPENVGSVWSRIGRAIYNPKDKSFCGRDAKRWGIVLLFYLIFYAVLALMFAICMAGLMYHIDLTTPTYTLDRSLIGSNPGVSYRPRPNDGFKIKYDSNNVTELDKILADLDEFFQPYQQDDNYKSENGCKSDDHYGYPETPCFFIKINRIYGWTPDYYMTEELPKDMPEDLVEHIKSLDSDKVNQVWISCMDNDNDTTIEYPWSRGLKEIYFPFLSQQEYMSPIVAVRVTPTVGKLITIKCRAWAKNIIYNKSMKHFSGYALIQIELGNITLTT